MDDTEVLKDIVLSKINDDDYAHKVFLKPIELVLKTHNFDAEAAVGELPKGLMHAFKKNGISDNCYQRVEFKPLDPNFNLYQVQEQGQDNLISYLKLRQDYEEESASGIELAICVCMYTENKTMLKDSIKGIEDNVSKLIKSGVNPDSIGVFVIMDGIEKVDPTIVDYFEELERQSHIYLGENNAPEYTMEDIQTERLQQKSNDYSEKFVEKNMNNFLFSKPELDDREDRRFDKIRKEYLEFKQTKNELLKLKSGKSSDNLYEKLPERVRQEFFMKEAREFKRRELKKHGSEIRDEQLMKQTQEIIQEYGYDPQKNKIIATEAINKALIYIDKYMSTRDELCYLGSFRKKIYLPIINKNDEEDQLVEEDENSVRYMNLFMCVKYKNAGKLSSHNWFFNGFCKELNPSFTILMDVGLKPEKESIYHMYTHMKKNPNVGGVCGYMKLKIEQVEDEEQIKDEEVDWLTAFTLNFVDIQKAQQMEYNFAHIIDKPFEAAFKFIHVLPGAFSGYNMKALVSEDKQDKLLKEYFRSIEQKLVENNIQQTDITLFSVLLRVLLPQFLYGLFYGVQPGSEEEMLYNENIFFAEDRILCMQIHKNGHDLVYLPDALAEVDPIKTVHGLMGQRKRWINGSYFAFEKVKKEIGNTNYCELALRLQVLFYDFLNVFIYFAPAIFFFTVHISMQAFKTDVLIQILMPIQASEHTNAQMLNFFVYTIDLLYALLLGTIIYYSLNTTSNQAIYKPYIYLVSTVLGLMAIAVLIVFLVDIIRGLTQGTIFLLSGTDELETEAFKILLQINRWMVVGVFGIYIIPLTIYSVLFKSFRPLVEAMKGALSFVFYNPTYIIILNFYALCRIDDISWGTKGLTNQNSKQSKMQEKWRLIKLIHVAKYVIWNIIASVLLITFAELPSPRFYIAFVIMISIVVTIGIKIFVGSIYLFLYKCKNLTCCGGTEIIQAKRSALNDYILQYKDELQEDVQSRIRDFNGEMSELNRQGSRGSYIMTMRSYHSNLKLHTKAAQKFKQDAENRSQLIRKNSMKPISPLPNIRQ